MRLILPKTVANVQDYLNLPMFFLAGPIRGGDDWHHHMTERLMDKFDDLIIVNPSRYDESHPHHKYRIGGTENFHERQTSWERYYLNQAGETWPTGCIIFWLANESARTPREGGYYGRETRGEIAEWRGRMMYKRDLRVVVGAEENFPGLSQIRCNFKDALPGFKIHSTMEAVVEQAVEFAKTSRSFSTRASV